MSGAQKGWNLRCLHRRTRKKLRTLTRLARRSSLLRVCRTLQQPDENSRRWPSVFPSSRKSRLRFAVPARIAHPRWRVSQARLRWCRRLQALVLPEALRLSFSVSSVAQLLLSVRTQRRSLHDTAGLFSALHTCSRQRSPEYSRNLLTIAICTCVNICGQVFLANLHVKTPRGRLTLSPMLGFWA